MEKINRLSKKKNNKVIFIFIFIFFLVGITGVFIYLETYSHPEKYAFEALVSDQEIEVIIEGPYTIFKPSIMKEIAFIFYPGGKVDHLAYAPVLRMISEKGYPVILVEMPFRLAVFGQNRATEAMKLLPEQTNFVIGGHSLGGAMAASYASKNTGKLKGLLLWASYPNKDFTNSKLSIGSIFGDHDGLIPLGKIEESSSLLPEDTLFYKIIGGNHAGFGAYGFQAGDLERTISAEEQRLEIVNSSLDFFDKLK